MAIPAEMEATVQKLKASRDKKDCLVKTYGILSQKYHGYRFKTYARFLDLFRWDIRATWKANGFLHCTYMNYLLKILLVRSGFFKEEDIRFKWTLIWFVSPHQYVKVKLSESEWVDVDIWARIYGIPFGSHAHGFSSGTFRRQRTVEF